MTAKTKMSNLEAYQELSIQITCLDMKLNKILELLNKPEIEYEIVSIHDHPHVGVSDVVREFNNTPPQWPNESSTDYLKRIGQYVEAQSDNENFEDSYK